MPRKRKDLGERKHRDDRRVISLSGPVHAAFRACCRGLGKEMNDVANQLAWDWTAKNFEKSKLAGKARLDAMELPPPPGNVPAPENSAPPESLPKI